MPPAKGWKGEWQRVADHLEVCMNERDELKAEVSRLQSRVDELVAEASMYREEICGRVEVIRRQDEEIEYLRDTTIPKVSLRDSGAVMGEIKILRSLHEKDADRITELETALHPFAGFARRNDDESNAASSGLPDSVQIAEGITLGDARAARAALENKGADP